MTGSVIPLWYAESNIQWHYLGWNRRAICGNMKFILNTVISLNIPALRRSSAYGYGEVRRFAEIGWFSKPLMMRRYFSANAAVRLRDDTRDWRRPDESAMCCKT